MRESSEMTQTGAELLVDCLEAEGVEYVFGIPGEELRTCCLRSGSRG